MKLVKGLKIVAEILLGLLVAFLLMMGIGEMIGGDFSGIGHLLPAAVFGLLMWFAWKYPLYAGIGLVLLSIVNSIPYVVAMNRSQDWYVPVLIMGVPLLFTGLLLLLAAWKTPRTAV